MSRPLRLQAAGLAYHVVARGNNKMRIFCDNLDYSRFLQIYIETVDRFHLDSWLVCAMPNHFHLVFRTREANLSAAARHLDGEYARWWNRRHCHVGHVFQGRFKAQVVEHGIYLLRLVRYVLLNPVRAKLVKHPADWRWSSYRYLATEEAGRLVNTASLVLAVDPDDHPATRQQLLDFVEGAMDLEMGELVRSDRRVIGSAAFAAGFHRQARAASIEVPGRERRAGTPSLVHLLSAAIERGAGLAGGIRDAHAAQYPIRQIAATAGIAERSVLAIVNQRRHADNRSCVRKKRGMDLAPAGHDSDLAPGGGDADLAPDGGDADLAPGAEIGRPGT